MEHIKPSFGAYKSPLGPNQRDMEDTHVLQAQAPVPMFSSSQRVPRLILPILEKIGLRSPHKLDWFQELEYPIFDRSKGTPYEDPT